MMVMIKMMKKMMMTIRMKVMMSMMKKVMMMVEMVTIIKKVMMKTISFFHSEGVGEAR